MKNNYESTEKQYEHAQRELVNLRNTANSLQSQIASLNNQLQQQSITQNNYNNQIQALNTQINSIDQQIKQKQLHFTNLQNEFNQLNNNQTNLNNNLTEINNKIAQTEEETKNYTDVLLNLDNILGKYSEFNGIKIDTYSMAIEVLPKKDVPNAELARKLCEEQSIDSFNKLLEKIDINGVDVHGMSLLHYALKHGFWYGVDKLLEMGTDVNIIDKSGHNALMYACTMPHMKYVTKIAEKTENINLKIPATGDTALHLLFKNVGTATDKVWSDERSLIQKSEGKDESNDFYGVGTLIVTGNMTISSIGVREDGYTLNQARALAVCKILQEKGVNFYIKNNEGYVPCIYLYSHLQQYLVKELQSAGMIDENKFDETGFQLAVSAMIMQDNPLFEKIVTTKSACMSDKASGNGDSLMHIAVRRKDLGKVKFLLEKGADQNMKNEQGLTSFYLACAIKDKPIAEFLLQNNPNLTLLDNTGQNGLSWIAELQDTALLQKVLNTGININHQDINGKTLLFWMVQYGAYNMVDYLLKNGADMNIPMNGSVYPLTFAIEKNDFAIFKILVSHKSTNLNCQTDVEATAFYFACLKGNIRMMQELKNAGADINIPNKAGYYHIHGAIHYGNIEVVKELMKYGVSIDTKSKNGSTPLQYYCSQPNTNVEVVKFLLESGANINEQDGVGMTAFYLSCLKGDVLLTNTLKNAGANMDILNKSGYHPIHAAVHNGHVKIIEELLKWGIPIDVKSTDGYTALQYYCQQPNAKIEVVEFLFDKGASLNCSQSQDKKNLLHSAVIGNNLDVINLIINKNIDVNSVDAKDVTPLYAALGYYGQTINMSVVSFLIARGADVNKCMNDGDTPMHMAAYRANISIMKLLLSKGANINSENLSHKTPLHSLIEHKGRATASEKLLAAKYLLDNAGVVNKDLKSNVTCKLLEKIKIFNGDENALVQNQELLDLLTLAQNELLQIKDFVQVDNDIIAETVIDNSEVSDVSNLGDLEQEDN